MLMLANDKVLYENKWIRVLDREGWTMYQLPWCKGGYGVAILPFRRKVKVSFDSYGQKNEVYFEYLGRFEKCPAHGPEIKLTAITGGMDKEGELPINCALRELEEEAGIRVNPSPYDFIYPKGIIPLGEAFDSKSSDHKTNYYALDMDLADYEEVEATGDGSEVEKGAYAKWVSEEDCVNASELRLAGMIARLKLA